MATFDLQEDEVSILRVPPWLAAHWLKQENGACIGELVTTIDGSVDVSAKNDDKKSGGLTLNLKEDKKKSRSRSRSGRRGKRRAGRRLEAARHLRRVRDRGARRGW